MKHCLGAVNALYPMPVTLVGALVHGRPNILAAAHVGVMNHPRPCLISVGLAKFHHTNRGILENRTFSLCLPSEDLAAETDYCGLVTGRRTDKSAVFDLFYGELGTAPMVAACPLCMECRLDRVLDFPSYDVFVGEIHATYADQAVLTDGRIDYAKVRPLLFDFMAVKYWGLGHPAGDAYSIGKKIKTSRRSAAAGEGSVPSFGPESLPPKEDA